MQRCIDQKGFCKVASNRRWIRIASALLVFNFLIGLTAHAAFQETLWGGRPASMAGAFSALADDSNAPAYNPAGISYLEKNEITLMYAELYTGVDFHAGNDTSKLGLGYLSVVPIIKERRYGSYGVSWSNFAASNLYREDVLTFTAADAYRFDNLKTQPILSYGANLKLLKRSFSTDSRTDADPVFSGGRDSSAITGDLGLIARPNFALLPGLKVALVGQNLNQPDIGLASTDRVPARYTFGLAYQDQRYRIFNPSLDLSRRHGRTLVSAGWEGWFAKDTLAFRLGGNSDEVAGGLGYQFSIFSSMSLRLDYALLWPFNVDGTNGTHRISITTTF